MRKIDLSKKMVSFDGKPFKIGKDDITLKNVILTYLRNAQDMGLDDKGLNCAFEIGFVIGGESGEVVLSSDQYDTIKRLSDNGQVKTANGEEKYIFEMIIRIQAKKMIDEAEQVKN